MNEQYQELYQLLGSLCNEIITEAEHTRLQEILSQDANARQLYFQYLDLHLELSTDLPEESKNDSVPSVLNPIPQKRNSPRHYFKASLIALLVVIMVSAGVLFQSREPNPNQGLIYCFAKVTVPVVQTSQVRFAEGSAVLQVGSELELNKQYALIEGELELLFESGAEVILKGPAVFELTGAEVLRVDYGACSVHAPPGAEGFVVETPLSRIVDLGTRFSVNVNESGETDVQVVEGEAEVHSADARQESNPSFTRLTQGMAKRYSHDKKLIEKNIPFKQARYTKQLPDRIIKYSATTGPHGGVENLKSVTVQRDGKQVEYLVDELIGIEVFHFKGVSQGRGYLTTGLNDSAETLPETFGCGLLDADTSLTTGLINPGGSNVPLDSNPIINSPELKSTPNTPGMAIRFKLPVVNRPGPDIVLFDLHIIVHPVHGDQFHVSPVHFKPGLHSHTIRNFDINLSSAEALLIDQFKLYIFKQAVGSLDQLETISNSGGRLHVVRAKALATGIDLSDLGYEEGEKVTELFLQDALVKGSHLDPVFIAGFPE